MKNNVTSLPLTALTVDMSACVYDIMNERASDTHVNDSALRMLCVARQIALRFGKGWA